MTGARMGSRRINRRLARANSAGSMGFIAHSVDRPVRAGTAPSHRQAGEGSRLRAIPKTSTALLLAAVPASGHLRAPAAVLHAHRAILPALRRSALRRRVLLATALMTRDSALPSGVTRLLARPLVRRSLLVRGLSALAGDFTLLGAVHGRETTIFLCHVRPPP